VGLDLVVKFTKVKFFIDHKELHLYWLSRDLYNTSYKNLRDHVTLYWIIQDEIF